MNEAQSKRRVLPLVFIVKSFTKSLLITGLITKKGNCDISNTLNAVAASKFQDTFFSR